jgi:hypothetical protein
VRPSGQAGRRLALLGLLALQVALHARYLDRPPYGRHDWRQVLGLSVARNFYEEGMNPLLPRIDGRGRGAGVTGMELPLLNYTIALVYVAVGGVSRVVERAVPLAFSLLAIVGCVAWLAALLGSTGLGLAGGFLLIASPLFVHYSITALPEIPMLAFLFLGLMGLTRWSTSGEAGAAVAGTLAFGLATLVKTSAVVAWPVAALLLARGWPRADARARVLSIVAVVAAVAAVLAWYAWARYLATQGPELFLLRWMFPYSLRLIPELGGKVLFQWLPEMAVSYPEAALVALGVWQLARTDPLALRAPVLAYTGGVVLFLTAMLPQLRVHDYYLMPALPLLVLLATLGVAWLDEARRAERAGARAALAVVAMACAIVGPARGLSRLEGAHPDAELVAMEGHLGHVIPEPDALVVAANDSTGCIYLYFMHRKGWTLLEDEPQRLPGLIARGARYLISDSRALEGRPEVAPLLVPLSTHGRFKVFRLVPAREGVA